MCLTSAALAVFRRGMSGWGRLGGLKKPQRRGDSGLLRFLMRGTVMRRESHHYRDLVFQSENSIRKEKPRPQTGASRTNRVIFGGRVGEG